MRISPYGSSEVPSKLGPRGGGTENCYFEDMKSQLCHLGEDFGLVLVHFAFLEQDARDWEI